MKLLKSAAICMVFLLGGCAATGGSKVTTEEAIGTAHIQRGHYELAEDEFRKVLAQHPNDPGAHYELGRIESLRGNAEAAREHFERVLQVQPYNAAAHANLGWALVQLHRLDEAEGHFKRALKMEDQQSLAWAGLGAIDLERHEPKRAYKDLNKALSFDPDNPLAHYYLGQYFDQTNDRKRAVEHYRLCSEQENPKRSEAYYELACCYADMKKKDAALNALQQAAKYGFKSPERVKKDARFKPYKSEVESIFSDIHLPGDQYVR